MLEYVDFKIYIYIWIPTLVLFHHLHGLLFYVLDTTKQEKCFFQHFSLV